MSELLASLSRFGAFQALVIGDFMLDELVYGDASRLSPDVPVPVLRVERTERSGGGASNVASCMAWLGGLVNCCGVIGGDTAGAHLQRSLEQSGCAVTGLVVDADRPTTVKQGLVGLAQDRHRHKMFRLDIESDAPLSSTTSDAIDARIEELIEGVQVVCIEDYGKGVCSDNRCRKVMASAAKRGLPVMVDPASCDDYSRYRGATVMTPNRTEAKRVCQGLAGSPESPEDMAVALLEFLELDAIVITLDRHGALLLERGGTPEMVPTIPRDVYDVSGAGDMVLAALAAGRAHDLCWRDCVVLANAAAGLEVEVFGAQPIALSRVVQEVVRMTTSQEGKVRSREALTLELAAHRDAGHRVVLTNGCFDVIHAGHVAYLRDARDHGDVLVVGVNVDTQVHAMKGQGRPVYSLDDRMAILSELACVDFVVAFDEPTAHALIDEMRPDLYVKGGDYAPDQVNEYEHVRSLGIECRVLAHRPGLGSTDVVDHLRNC
jgi:D-beta-D-heptose 7-phosphate kinase/D-beta-D-heptose 1-phosphate adenosyltransferase